MLTGLLLGFAFLAKMLQASWWCRASPWPTCGPGRAGWQAHVADGADGAGIIVGAGWWILAAELTPAADRPYFGGSTNNNILQLAIGYNGLGRMTGDETGSVGPGRAGGGAAGRPFGGATGIFRLFHEFGGQISWLLPAALISLAAMAWVSRRAPRTDRTRAAALLWGGWVLVTGLVFSYMNGIIHPYYMVALAPGIAALTGIGARSLWRAPLGAGKLAGRMAAACGVLATAVWAYILLDRTPDWLPWLRWAVLIAGVAAAGLMLAGPALARLRRPGWGAGPAGGVAARAAGAGRGAARPGPGGRAGRAGRVRAGHGGHGPHRRDPERRASLGWLRRRSRRPGRPPRCRAVRPRPGRNRDG